MFYLRKFRFFSLCCTLIIAVTIVGASTPKPEIQGTIFSVGDGDTLTISRSDSGSRAIIRLGCVDAPEIAQAPWGKIARDRLRELLPQDRKVKVRPITVDRYRRIVGEVFTTDEPINLTLTRSGHVVAYRQYLRGCDRNRYIEAENSARASKLNFWSQQTPVMPWDYRASRKK